MSYAALAVIAATAWSPTHSLPATADAAPRAAIDAQGHALVAYITRAGLQVSRRRGSRFTTPKTLARTTYDHAVAPGAVAYETPKGVYVALAPAFKPRRVASSTGSEINGLALAADPLGGWVLAERQFPRRGSGPRDTYRVRTLSLDASGAPIGTPQDLGAGQFGIDARPTQALAVLPDGRAVLAFQREGEDFAVVSSVRPHGGAFSAPAPVGEGLSDPRVTLADDRAVITAIADARCGDTQCAGQPRAFPLDPGAAPQGPIVRYASRAFAPWATPDAIVFQYKTEPRPFSREAPIRAAALTPGAPVQTLTRLPSTEPVALPLSGGRTLAVWANRKALDAALAGPDGRFHGVRAPHGAPPSVFHDNDTNRDARSAGPYAIVTWVAGTKVRVSVRRF